MLLKYRKAAGVGVSRRVKVIFLLSGLFLISISAQFLLQGISISPAPVLAGDYPPELSGNLEVGDRIQLEDGEESGGEVLDCDYYQRCWLKYKQQLKRYDYYYLKLQYYQKEYEKEIGYNNCSIDLWGNYTYQLKENLRNGWLLNLRSKDYYWNNGGDYLQLRIKYQLDFAWDENNDYTFYLQREWQQYTTAQEKDHLYDRVSLSWEHQLQKNLQLDTRLEFNREQPLGTNLKSKNGRKLSVGFSWDIEPEASISSQAED